MNFKTLALGGAALGALLPAVGSAAPATVPVADRAAPVSALVREVNIPYQEFTLPNGLRVIVHTDRKAPVVAVSVWYNVGSKFEPKGKTGFAHLFEHLMFYGSENHRSEFFEPLEQAGATDYNGTTYFDRTNYFETVPTGALDLALFLESDRMGYLTGAITQSVLDQQRGVVENEKREDDNQPYGLSQYKVTEGLFPASHPYGHTTIGSMTDIESASLADVKGWFRGHYGPNNAVLVLAGDIDLPTARRLVTKYFGGIPAGPKSVAPPAPIVTLAQPKREVIRDRVAQTLISRNWTVPGLRDPQSVSLDVAAGVLGGLSSSRLKTILVRQEKLATRVSVSNESFAQLGHFSVDVYVRPGVDPALVDARVEAIIADFLQTGPTADEVRRYVTSSVAGTIAGYQSVGGFSGKAVALAEGELYANDPGFYKKQLTELAAQTPASVKAAADQWLSRPVYELTVVPGAREAYQEVAAVAPKSAVAAEPAVKGTRGPLPIVGDVPPLSFPAVERTRLRNGIELVYAQRASLPLTFVSLSFDAGKAADIAGRLGTEQMTLTMLTEGTTSRDSNAIARDEERLGAQLSTGLSADRASVGLFVPSLNLGPALDLYADVVRNPAFAPAEVDRIKNQRLAGIAQELTDPNALAGRVMPRLLFGGSPYAKDAGSGDPKAVAALTRDDLVAFQRAWLRPDKAKIFVVSDRPLAEVKAALDQRFGDWRASGAPGVKDFAATPAVTRPRIVLVDRPDSPQSVVFAGQLTPLKGTDDLIPVNVANDGLAGSILGRVNMDLRETKHWSYGAGGAFTPRQQAVAMQVGAGVQADKTGPSLAAMRGDIVNYLGPQPMTQVEFGRAIASSVRSLSGDFETSEAVLQGMQRNDLFHRPENYYATITQRYRALTLPQVQAAIRGAVDPARFVWVVIGDASKVKAQLDPLGLPIEVLPAAEVASPR